MKHFGDITKIKGSEVPLTEIVVGGSPCQDLSVAGKRKGLAGERSGLFMEQIRLIKEMRNESFKQLSIQGTVDPSRIIPRFMVWENVPGAFSSNNGEDFRAVLEETARVKDKDAAIPRLEGKQKWSPSGCIMGDGWSIAWRVHDAQFWGVPQRRKRIALVADFGGESAPEILFECKGMSGDITESGKEGEGAASDAGAGIEKTSRAISFQERAGKPGGGKGILIQDGRTGALSTLNNQSVCYPINTMVASRNNNESRTTFGVGDNGEAQFTLSAAHEHAVCYGICSDKSNSMLSGNPHSGIYEADTSRTLDLNGGSPACNQGGMAVVCLEGNGSRPSHKGDGYAESETMYTLNSTEHHAVAVESHAQDARYNVREVNQPLSANMEHDPANGGLVMAVENHPNDSRVKISEDGMVQTLSSRMGTGGGNVPLVFSEVAAARCAQDGRGGVHTQMMSDPESNFVLESVSFGNGQLHDAMLPSVEISKTLNCMADPAKIVAYGLDRASFNQGVNAQYDFAVDEEKIGTQVAKGPGAVCQSVVRRLTPLECERLQGYPDGWTDIGDWVDSKGKKHKGESDAPRYKALGNSIALPFWEWMAERMVKQLKQDGFENPTMASLFDGIGGFPLVFSRNGCKPIWASEIEEFPIAVTKIRFSEENK